MSGISPFAAGRGGGWPEEAEGVSEPGRPTAPYETHNQMICARPPAALTRPPAAPIKRSVRAEPVCSLGQPFTLCSRLPSYFIDGPCRPRIVTGLSTTLRFSAAGDRGPGLARCSPVPGTGDALRCSTARETAAQQASAAPLGSTAGATQVPLSESEVLCSTFEKAPSPGAPLRNRTVDLLLTITSGGFCYYR